MSDLTDKQYQALMYGSDEKIESRMERNDGDGHWARNGTWEGLLPQAERLYSQTKSEYRRKELEKFMRISGCPSCHGQRLKEKILSILIDGKSIIDVTDLSISNCNTFFRNLTLTPKEEEIGHLVLKEIHSRLGFLEEVGLGYITLSRAAGTLSGGEV